MNDIPLAARTEWANRMAQLAAEMREFVLDPDERCWQENLADKLDDLAREALKEEGLA